MEGPTIKDFLPFSAISGTRKTAKQTCEEPNEKPSNGSGTCSSTKASKEMQRPEQPESIDLDPHSDTEIQYRYIDFDSELPPEVILWLDGMEPAKSKLPRLDKFTSPQQWPRQRKEMVSWLCYIASALASHAASSYSPAKEQLSEYWHIGGVATLVGITTFTTGFALAPMALAPLSEINGRKPVFVATGILFVVCQICSGATQSYAGMLLARFFAGVGSSTYSSMVGGVIADIYPGEERNTPMALFSCFALFGVGTGPLVSGFIAEYSSWRWIFYSQAIADGILVALFIVAFQESRASVLLRWKASTFNALHAQLERAVPSTPRIRWKSRDDEQRGTITQMIRVSLTLPFRLLVTDPVVFFFSLWAAFAWSVLYISLAAVPLVYTTTHAFSLAHSNAVFAAMCTGALVFTPLAIYQDRLVRRLPSFPSSNRPEARLHFACVASALLPAGLFLFGWTARRASGAHWAWPAVAIGVATAGVFAVYLAVFNYLSDAYGRFASSALAAQSFCRNGLGGVLALVAGRMFEGLGYGVAGSVLGAVAAALTGVPWVLVLYGERIRARSKFASAL